MKSTDGPWGVHSLFVGPLEIRAPDGRVVAMVAHEEFSVCASNAELIAAAPDLLKACELAADMLRDGGTFPIEGLTWGVLREAIAKAKGLSDGC